ncbi:hypothetical protein JVU11DRAFT_2212 [Chiua virens]|nr:hypothetical protein JVU11DRAFT_2212 [Chiua virens]
MKTLAAPSATHVEDLPQGLMPPRYPLRSWQVSWAVGCFYDRECWDFASREERREFFLWLVRGFDERWPMRRTIFPQLPLDVALNNAQLQELEKRKLDLHFHFIRLWKWVQYGLQNFGLDFDIQVVESAEE